MAKIISIHKGFDIKMKGAAEKTISSIPVSGVVAVKLSDFHNVVPKMLVEPGNEVLAGQALFFDKNRPDIRFSSPVSGIVNEIIKGEKRRITEVHILPDKSGISYIEFPKMDISSLSKEFIIKLLLESGCWTYIRQRPYSLIANPEDVPKGIFVSCFDTAPLAPSLGYMIGLERENFQSGLKVLQILAEGRLHVSLPANLEQNQSEHDFTGIPAENIRRFKGPHPSGNVGIQIHHIDPIQKSEKVWYVHPQDIIIIGRLFREGRYHAERLIALTGSCFVKPAYAKMISGQKLDSFLPGSLSKENCRLIQGNVLSGKTSHAADFLSYYENQLTAIPEGDKPEFLGWLQPGFNKLSLSRTYFSWLFPNRKYELDTNMHGEERAFVMTGQYDKVLPMNIYPVYLLKAILAKDIERMEALGIYEISEEDFALCEFVCTSKIAVQKIVAEGLELIRVEG